MVKGRPVVVGTRGSDLALRQAGEVMENLQGLYPEREFTLKVIKTHGDKAPRTPISHFEGRGIFVKELELALLECQIDLAVHSLKDLPSETPQEMAIAAVTQRQDPRDVLISGDNASLARLPSGARVGTGSPRRAAQLLAFRPDLEMADIRGNVDTRIRKAMDGEYDGVILAAAGLLRLGWQDRITEYIPLDICVPAVGQGALAVETRAGDEENIRLASTIDHAPTRQAIEAERALLQELGGGCQVPIAAHGRIMNGMLHLTGVVASPDGKIIIRAEGKGDVDNPMEVGRRVAQKLAASGAERVLVRVVSS